MSEKFHLFFLHNDNLGVYTIHWVIIVFLLKFFMAFRPL